MSFPELDFVQDAAPSDRAKQDLLHELRRNFQAGAFSLLPRIQSEASWILARGKDFGLSDEQIQSLIRRLLRTGLWLSSEKGYQLNFDLRDLGDLKVDEHLAMTLAVASRLSETGPCWYESFVVVTNEDSKKKFLKTINQAIKDLIDESAQSEGGTVLAWSHASLDALKWTENKGSES